MTARRKSPERPWRAARISSRMVRASPTMRRAQSSTRLPSGVSPPKREPRQTRSTPSCSSSCLIPAERLGCVMPRLSAALPKCRSRARAMNISSLSITALSSLAPGREPRPIALHRLPGARGQSARTLRAPCRTGGRSRSGAKRQRFVLAQPVDRCPGALGGRAPRRSRAACRRHVRLRLSRQLGKRTRGALRRDLRDETRPRREAR